MTKEEHKQQPGFMSAGQLVALLSRYNKDTPIVTPGFDESGYDFVEVEGTLTVGFKRTKRGFMHGGRFQEVGDSEGVDSECLPVKAIVLNMSSYQE